KALLKMRDELNSYRHEMESKVSEQTIEIRRQKDEVNEQRLKVLNLYNDLQASIDYALKIQQTILPTDQYVKECFPESFVLYQPKATVSGDFYWCASKGSKRMLAAADCTGHGVPGAFMSLVGYNAFNQAVKVFLKPAQVMNSVNRFSVKAMRAEGLEQGLKDGMDVAFISYDIDTRELLFAAAKNSGFVARQGEMITLEADSFSVGAHYAGEKEFSQCSMTMESGDTLYLFSDGFADQFGGPDGKKFMRRRFKELLLESSKLGIEEQQEFIQKTYAAWQGDLEQVDDVMVIGIRF
ncbi:MAG: PP2C family protein-serine/threonine phosphatase, partial [Flavobacteriales bacterium]